MATATKRDRLKAMQERVANSHSRVAAARRAIAAAQQQNDPDAECAARDALEVALDEREVARELENRLLAQFSGVGSGGLGGSGATFLDDPQALGLLERAASTSKPMGRIELGPWCSREEAVGFTGRALAAGQVDPTPNMGRAGLQRIVDAPQPAGRFLDFILSAPMDVPSYPYARQTGAAVGAAVQTPGAPKAQATIEFEDAEAKPATVAAWTKVKRQSLADAEGLANSIRTRLMYGLTVELERQVISGDGVGENLRGILNTTGIASVPFAAGQPADLILDGIVALLQSGAQPNVVACNPLDWRALLTAKASGSGEYVGGGPFGDQARRIWATAALVPAIGVPQATALVGDTTLGTRLLVRDAPNVLVSDADQDDFVRNKVTLLGEGRWALVLEVPAAWAAVDLAA